MYEAERYYDGGSTGFCNECHEPETWETLDIEEYEVYEGDNTEDHIDAWTVNNPGVSNSEVYTPSGADQEQVFMGGFNPVCPDGEEWLYDDERSKWVCGGALDMTQTVMQPNIDSNSEIGLAVMPYFTQLPEQIGNHVPEGTSPYIAAVRNNDDVVEQDGLESLHARCWLGTLDDDPEELEPGKLVEGEVDIDTTVEKPFGIYGEVDREDEDNSYACQWEYRTTEDISSIAETGQLTDNTVLQNKGSVEQLDSDTGQEFKNEYGIPDNLEYSNDTWEDQIENWEKMKQIE